jgi:hypothetical protein
MTFAEAMAEIVTTPGIRVSRTSYYNTETSAYLSEWYWDGALKLDSGEQVGVVGWVASTEEQQATDWVVTFTPE